MTEETKRQKVLKRRMEVMALVQSGKQTAEIVELFDLPPSMISNDKRWLVERRLLPIKKAFPHHVANALPVGNLKTQLKKLPPETIKWLERNVPKGGSIAEFAVACMVDAYEEER